MREIILSRARESLRRASVCVCMLLHPAPATTTKYHFRIRASWPTSAWNPRKWRQRRRLRIEMHPPKGDAGTNTNMHAIARVRMQTQQKKGRALQPDSPAGHTIDQLIYVPAASGAILIKARWGMRDGKPRSSRYICCDSVGFAFGELVGGDCIPVWERSNPCSWPFCFSGHF